MKFDGSKKQIVYRGGLVRFSIPTNWVEEYEEAGGGTFYDAADSSTLRLNVLSFLCDHDVSARHPLELLIQRAPTYNGVVEELSGDRFLLKYTVSAQENGEALSIFRWEVVKMVSLRDYNVAAFSFTVESARSQSNEVLQTCALIEGEVKEVQFGMYTGFSE
jgi:hypothetical protein